MRGLPFKKEAHIRLPANPYPLFRSKHSLRHSPLAYILSYFGHITNPIFHLVGRLRFEMNPHWKAPILSLLSKHMNRHA